LGKGSKQAEKTDYISMKNGKKTLTFKNVEIRSTDTEGKRYIEGMIPYNSRSVPIWGVTEIIGRTAFNKTLKDKTEVRAFWNHNDSFVLGNTRSGTLELEDSDDGLTCRCELPNTSYANDLYEVVSRGDVKTMSFGFRPIKWDDTESGKVRTLKEVQLDEVSFGVPYAAYQETNSQTYMRGFMKRKIDIESINAILEKDELTEEDLTALRDVIDTLNTVIKKNSPEAEGEAARAEPPKEDTPKDESTSPEPQEEKNKDKEAIKQEILGLIDLLFEIEKETEAEPSEEPEKEETA
jgi:HK97 family phage prohead protease